MIIARTIEVPREWSKDRVKSLYPDYLILGSPYGWFYAVEETKTCFINYGWRELVRDVNKHLKGNGIHVPADLNLEMMAEFCRVTSSPSCAESDPDASERQRYMTMASRFLRAVEDAVMNGLVQQDEADRRAEICSRCPHNVKEKFRWCVGCAAQSAAAKLAKFALNKSTPHDGQINSCDVCFCNLPLKVWVRREGMDYPELRKDWWEECWMREGN